MYGGVIVENYGALGLPPLRTKNGFENRFGDTDFRRKSTAPNNFGVCRAEREERREREGAERERERERGRESREREIEKRERERRERERERRERERERRERER